MKRLISLLMAVLLVVAFNCGKQNPVDPSTESDKEMEYMLNEIKKLEKHDTYPVNFTIDYTKATITDSGTHNYNERTSIDHVRNRVFKGGVIEGDIAGLDTMFIYGHTVHVRPDGSSDRFFRHGNGDFVVTWHDTLFFFKVLLSHKAGRDYAYGWNFLAWNLDHDNKIAWTIVANLKADNWQDFTFDCQGELRKFYFEKRNEKLPE